MAEVSVPRYLIAQRCLPGGWRTSKKPEIPRPVVMRQAPLYSNLESAPGLKDFLHWEYRFWAAAEMEDGRGVITECRACQSVFSSSAARKEHLGRMGCSRRLVDAFKLLLKDKMCVICNMRSYQEKWGVPLCSKACCEAWCAVEAQPDALKQALTLVGEVK
jgi:hypothetical protein